MNSDTEIAEDLPHLDDSAAYIDGAFRRLSTRIDVLEKATGNKLGSAGSGSIEDLDDAVAAARSAQRQWARTPYGVRAALVRSVAVALEERLDQFVDLIVKETGSIPGKADYEVHGAIDELHAAAGLATLPRGELLESNDPGRFGYAERIPVGIVGVITPWNFPLILAMRVIAPAIALGNAVILKPSPETPLSGGIAIADAFEAAGAPTGLFQVVCGETAFSEALVAHAGIDMVHFTGSTAVGSKIASTAGGLLKRVSLELGGNNALLVLDDADPDYASMLGAWSSFHYQGQTCISASRHIVASSVVDAYVARLADRAAAISVGDPSLGAGLGPMINERQAARAEGILRRSVEQGARVVTGGTREGLFFQPTVVTGVTRDMPIWTEEVFAPIAPVLSVVDDAEAVAVANDTEYGLVDAVVTRDEGRGRRMARQLHAGMVHVNDVTPVDEAIAPFGGVGASGLGGRAGGLSNIDEFTTLKWTSVQENRLAYPY